MRKSNFSYHYKLVQILFFAGKSLEGVAHPSPLNAMGYLPIPYPYANGSPLQSMVSLRIFKLLTCAVFCFAFMYMQTSKKVTQVSVFTTIRTQMLLLLYYAFFIIIFHITIIINE